MTLPHRPVTLADLQRAVRARGSSGCRRSCAASWRPTSASSPRSTRIYSRCRGRCSGRRSLLLADEATGALDPRTTTLAAVVELIHLATLVHDDSVDHSVLRRGMPTINSLFSHQVSVIMGDYLYSRAVIELVRLDDLEPFEY